MRNVADFGFRLLLRLSHVQSHRFIVPTAESVGRRLIRPQSRFAFFQFALGANRNQFEVFQQRSDNLFRTDHCIKYGQGGGQRKFSR